MTSPQTPLHPEQPHGQTVTPFAAAPQVNPVNPALATFKFGHIVGLFVFGVLLAQLTVSYLVVAGTGSALDSLFSGLGSRYSVNSDAIDESLTQLTVYTVLLSLVLPYAIFTTTYLRRGAALDRILSSVFLLLSAIISIVAAVKSVPAFYSVAAIFLLAVLLLEWFGPFAGYWQGKSVDFSKVKSLLNSVQAAAPAGQQYYPAGQQSYPAGQQYPAGVPYNQFGQGQPTPPASSPYTTAPFPQPGAAQPGFGPGQPGAAQPAPGQDTPARANFSQPYPPAGENDGQPNVPPYKPE